MQNRICRVGVVAGLELFPDRIVGLDGEPAMGRSGIKRGISHVPDSSERRRGVVALMV